MLRETSCVWCGSFYIIDDTSGLNFLLVKTGNWNKTSFVQGEDCNPAKFDIFQVRRSHKAHWCISCNGVSDL